ETSAEVRLVNFVSEPSSSARGALFEAIHFKKTWLICQWLGSDPTFTSNGAPISHGGAALLLLHSASRHTLYGHLQTSFNATWAKA
ncbi:MAG: hypothetical protein RSD05_05675, partial [Comamonas sp.]